MPCSCVTLYLHVLPRADMFVEDAVSAQGPITLIVAPSLTVAELKQQVEKQFEIPAAVQKWILDKSLVSEDGVTLASQGVDKDGARIYLYLVSPEEAKEAAGEAPAPAPAPAPARVPQEPVQKGRYWNYEEDRWSVCNSDEDDDEEIVVKGKAEVQNATEPRPTNFQFIPAPKDVEKALEVVKEAEAVKEVEAPKVDGKAGVVPKEEEEGEWEYYYEEEADKPKTEEKAKPKIEERAKPKTEEKAKPNIENLVANHIEKRNEQKKEAVVEEVVGWECPVCTLMNPMERPGCQACTTERPPDMGAAAAQPTGTEIKEKDKAKETKKENNLDAYKQLENLDIIPNAETFECTICFMETEPGDGVVLRECLHIFCK